jgi:ribosomal-protein-alanine N-acetyltransferase
MSFRPKLTGRRLVLRPFSGDDYESWRAIRQENVEWLEPWESRQAFLNQADLIDDRRTFAMRCSGRDRERQLGTGWAFGVFLESSLIGEMNLSNVVRGAFQNAHVGYWIDRDHAGHGYTPEALVVAARFAFEDIGLHRLQVSIVPRNRSSRRVVEKLDLRCEGLAERYLEINGVWEDHLRYAMTFEEWRARAKELSADWLD